MTTSLASVEWGSSPLTWGKPLPRRPGARRLGLIPAHVGKTFVRVPSIPGSEAHPRSRGENRFRIERRHEARGSSPLTWGKRRRHRRQERQRGLIPAHVGKTKRMAAVSQRIRAHPRSRWENTNVYRLNIGCDGSSPLTWGKLAGHHDHHRIAGLIPAHVGKTAASAASEKLTKAHPRSRGENNEIERVSYGFEGSSPLTWGKQ